jgi:MFS family permease
MDKPEGRASAGVWVLAIGLLDFSLERAIVVPALPAIQVRHHTTPTAVTWVLTGFLLAAAVSTDSGPAPCSTRWLS